MTRPARPRRKPILWSTRQSVVPAAWTLSRTASRLRISSRPSPVAGSSRSNSSGSHMRAMAMPSIFSSPYERLPASCRLAPPRLQRASTSATRSARRRSTSRAAPTISSARRRPSSRLSFRWLATCTFSNTLSSAKTCGFWKVLTTPCPAMMSGRRRWISRPFHSTWPEVGGRSPAIMLSSVVLPEPLGPMMPTISSGSTVKETSATAIRPTKRLVSPRTSRGTPGPPGVERAHDASRHHEDREDQNGAVEHGAKLGPEIDGMRQAGEHEGAHDGPGEGALATQQDHGQYLHRLIDAEVARVDVPGVVTVKAAGERGEGIADGKGEELVAEHVEPEGAGEVFVEADGAEAAPHPRPQTAGADQHRHGEADKGEVVPGDGPLDGDHAAPRPVDRRLARHHEPQGAVGDAVPVHDHEPDHLREGERDHREVEGLEPELEADAAHDRREHHGRRRGGEGGRPERQPRVDGEQMGHVGGDAEDGRVKHRQLAREAEDQVEGHREDAVDEREDEDGEQEIAAHEEGQRVQRAPEERLARHSSPNRPAGRKSRMATSTARPYASRKAVGRRMEPTPSMTPRMTPPHSEPMRLPIPPRIAASMPLST